MSRQSRCGTCLHRRSTCTIPPFDTYCDVLGDGLVLVRVSKEKRKCARWASLQKELDKEYVSG
jgi:hypothetical protein